MTFRWLTSQDAAIFRPIRLEALQRHPRAFRSRYEEWADRPIDDFAQVLAAVRVVMAYDGDTPIGFMGWQREAGISAGHRGVLVAVYLRAQHRGRGIAAQLLDAVCADAARSIDQLHLGVAAENADAIALYRKAGFLPYGREPRSHREGSEYLDEILMAKRLDT